MNSISKAIILSAGPNGLGALRSLYKENIRADIITGNIREPVMSSRLPINKVVLKKPFDTEGLLDILLNWPLSGQVLIPTSDWYVDFLATNETVLRSKFDFILPKGELSQEFIDKQKEVELVKNFVELPKSITHLPKTAQELKAELPLPLIIKPRSNELNRLGKKNIVISTNDELEAFYQVFESVLEFCIAQDLIIGGDHNLWVCNCVFDFNGELINAFTFQRLQLSPPHYGVTCYAKSIENKEILAQVAKLGAGLNYSGPAMVEFKLDDRDQKYKYIEVNPRLGLCNYFDTSCGKNNVYATYCLAKGLPFKETSKQKSRVFISVYEDLYSRYCDNQSVVHIVSLYLRDIIQPHTFIYFSWQDPWPAIVIGGRQLKNMFNTLIRKIKRK